MCHNVTTLVDNTTGENTMKVNKASRRNETVTVTFGRWELANMLGKTILSTEEKLAKGGYPTFVIEAWEADLIEQREILGNLIDGNYFA
jgi:hypothetical protein